MREALGSMPGVSIWNFVHMSQGPKNDLGMKTFDSKYISNLDL